MAKVEHVLGIYNKVYGDLSQGLTEQQVGLTENLEVILTPLSMATQYNALCNPQIDPLGPPSEHLELSKNLFALGQDPFTTKIKLYIYFIGTCTFMTRHTHGGQLMLRDAVAYQSNLKYYGGWKQRWEK